MLPKEPLTPVVVGVDHRQASIALRERLAFDPATLGHDLTTLREYVAEGVILSTCNRTEIYAAVAPGQPSALLRRFLSETRGISESLLDGVLYTHKERDAVRRLYRVSSGLESMVLGEPQILGQVRDALTIARNAGTVAAVLSRLFSEAIRVGKSVRTETGVGRNRVSVSHAALDLAASHLGTLQGRDALIVGAGEMAALTAKLLRGAKVRKLVVANRSEARGRALAARLDGSWIPLAAVANELPHVDMAFTAAAAPAHLLTPSVIDGNLDARQHPLVLVDLGLPRNVDPAVRANARLRLFDVDDLAAPMADLRQRYETEIEKAEAIVEEAVESFVLWQRSRAVAPVIKALREHAEEIQAEELARALRKLSHLSPRDRNVVEALSTAIVNKLLHRPITELKNGAGGEEAAAMIQQLFALAAPAPDLPPAEREERAHPSSPGAMMIH